MLNENFVILGAIIATLGSLSYLIDTIKGNVKPNRVSFFIWALSPLVAFTGEIQQGVGIESFMTFMFGFPSLIIFIASFINKKSEWKLGRFDFICGAISLVGLLLWFITKVGNVAIFFAIVADGLAALPTIMKSFNYPETESGWPWFTAAISAMFTLLAIKSWDFAHYGFPLYILIVAMVIFALVKFKLGKKINTLF